MKKYTLALFTSNESVGSETIVYVKANQTRKEYHNIMLCYFSHLNDRNWKWTRMKTLENR